MDINVIRLRNCLGTNEGQVKEEGDAFLDDLNFSLTKSNLYIKEGPVSVKGTNLILIESGGTETKFLKDVFGKIKPPYLLLTTGKNNSLPAALEIKTFLDNLGEEAVLLSGTMEQVSYFVECTVRTDKAYRDIHGSSLGVIGHPSDWLIASKCHKADVKEAFGIKIVDIPMEELYEEIDKGIPGETFRKKALMSRFKNQAVLNEALCIYGAIKRLVIKYKLSGLTIRCFDMLKKYHNTACLALSLLNDEGITAGCEGDVPALLTMHLLSKLSGYPCFMANPSRVDYAEGTLLLAHCTIPLLLCSSYKLDTHFESGEGIGIAGKMRTGQVTIAKICPDLHDLFITVADIKEAPSEPDCCRSQIVVSLDERAMKDFTSVPYGNHLVVTYGDHYVEMLTLLDHFEMASEKGRRRR